MAFHHTRFPLDIALGARGGPTRLTEIVTLGSGREERNARWAHSRRRYNAGYGIKSIRELRLVLAFFEERRGRLHGFLWRDGLDWRSGDGPPLPTDQAIGTGDGVRRAFSLVKRYGASFAPYLRPIEKPVGASVRVAVDGIERLTGWSVDETTGTILFPVAPAAGAAISAGFAFDVPVRFDTDRIEVEAAGFEAGQIPDIPLIEIVP